MTTTMTTTKTDERLRCSDSKKRRDSVEMPAWPRAETRRGMGEHSGLNDVAGRGVELSVLCTKRRSEDQTKEVMFQSVFIYSKPDLQCGLQIQIHVQMHAPDGYHNHSLLHKPPFSPHTWGW